MRFSRDIFSPAGVAFFLLAGFGAAFYFVAPGPFSAVVGVLVCILSLFVASACARVARRREALRIIGYLRRATQLNVSLPAFLQIAAADELPRPAQRLRTIAALLEKGVPLGEALASELPDLPPFQTNAIRAAEHNGTLPVMLARLDEYAARRTSSLDETPRDGWLLETAGDDVVDWSRPLIYFAVILIGFAFPFTLVVVFVLPKMSQIFRDFGAPLPTGMRQLISLGTFAGDFLPVAVCLCVLAALFVLTTRAARRLFFPRMTRRMRWLRLPRDFFAWHLPVIGGAIRDRDYADVCRVLSDGMQARRPIDAVIREAATMSHLSSLTAERLDSWHWRLQRGQSLVDAAREARLPGVIVGFLSDAGAGSQEAAFEFLARYYASKSHEFERWLAAATTYAVPLVCGVFVGWFAVSVLSPLWTLIDVVAPYKVTL